MMKHLWAWMLGVALVLGASLVSAAPGSIGREAERTALFEEGVELAAQNRWREAAEKFEQVVAIRSAPRARYTLGEAQEKSGLLASAKASYTKALDEARTKADKEAAAAAGTALAGIESRVPRLVLHFAEPVDGVQAIVDGHDVLLVEGKLELDPGRHDLVLRAPGYHPFEREVRAAEGRTVELTVELAPVESGDAQGTTGGASATTPAGAWVLGAAGLVATGIGMTLYFTGQSAYDDAEQECLNPDCSQRGNAEDANAARDQIIAGDVVMAVGAGAVVGAIIWLAVAASQSPDEEAAEHGRLEVGVGLTPGSLSVTIGGAL